MLKNGNATFSWRELVSDKPLTDADRRGFIEFKPILDFNALEPGKAATDAIRQAASDLNFAGQYGARVRLTGPVPIANEEFATVADGAVVNGIGTVLVVLFILWLALHSAKIISAVFANLFIGLSITTAIGLMMVGSLNLLSIAFAVLFVGLGVDFGIQFSVRYRSERFKSNDLTMALAKAAEYSAVPLSLAAMATAAGFHVVSADRLQRRLGTRQDRRCRHAGGVPLEHHRVAGIAQPAESRPAKTIRSVTPSLPRSIIFSKTIASSSLSGRLLVAAAGLPLLYFLHFDFNPMQSAQSRCRIDRDLSRSEKRSEHRRQRHQRDDELGS